jgi:hypothetical protein
VDTLTSDTLLTTDAGPAPHRGWLIATAIGALGASAVYIGTTLLGGAIVPGYSHVEDSVSSLTSPGAPFRAELGVGYAVYNAAVVVMAIGLLRTSRSSMPVRIATALLAIGAVAGVLMVEPFPQDPMGAPLTPPGIVHLILAGVTALGLVAAAVLYGVAWRRDPVWRRISTLSIAAGVVILVTGGVGAAFVTSPVFGLLERVTQVSFLAWFATIGVVAISAARQHDRRVTSEQGR